MYQNKPEPDEALLTSLRALYGRNGYAHYKMNKFEEYDLYAHHKDFLVSDSVITFTDGSGKLLALKPDVTLSIVKNSKDLAAGVEKLFYTENVYRVAKGSRNFREIMQVGLECLGKVDDYCLFEVLSLALESLAEVAPSHVLSVSHLGLLTEVMDAAPVPEDLREKALRFLGEKNLHELSALLDAAGLKSDGAAVLLKLAHTEGSAAEVLPALEGLLRGVVRDETLDRFLRVMAAFRNEPSLRVDFSVVGDIHYYNGFIFKGFAEGIPTAVLSGGQYDTLMRKMGRRASAVGFAVYLDVIGQYRRAEADFDVDVLLLYPKDTSPAAVRQAVKTFTEQGESVLAEPELPAGIRHKRLATMEEGEVKVIETHA